jgi:hypothetical protein
MSESHSDILTRAYELVEAGQPDEARALLDRLLKEDPGNPDAWWIYAYSVDDPVLARQALNNVLRLNPNYPEAAGLLANLDEQYPELSAASAVMVPPPPLPESLPAEEVSLEEPDFLPPAHASENIDDEIIPEPYLDTIVEPSLATKIAASPTAAPPPEKRRSSLWLWIAAAVVLILVLLALLFLPRSQPSTTDALTQVAQSSDAGAQAASPESTAGAVVDVTAESSPAVESTSDTASGTQVVIQVTPLATLSGDLATEDASQQATLDMSSITALPGDATPTIEVFETLALPSGTAEETETFAEIVASETAISSDATQISAGGTEVSGAEFSDIANALNQLSMTDVAIERIETSMGQTLVASVCSGSGVDLRETLPQVMDAVAENLEGVSSDYTAVGSRMVDCANSSILRLIVVDREIAEAYRIGGLTQPEYEGAWISM